jgi:aryl-alcohol dehydrogenase-like predicted oxidoreductase
VDSHTAIEETLGALDRLVTAGKVRYLGCSNYSAWQLMKALGLSAQLNVDRFSVLQAYYSLVARELEWELIPLCLDQNLGLLVWSPLAAGFLTGKYRELAELPAGARLSSGWSVGTIDAQAFRIVDKLKELADERGVSVPQVALNYLLRKRGVTSLIIGARNQDQLEDNFGALSWSLDDQELLELDAASERPLPYPYWHQQSVGEERCTDWIDRPAANTASLE